MKIIKFLISFIPISILILGIGCAKTDEDAKVSKDSAGEMVEIIGGQLRLSTGPAELKDFWLSKHEVTLSKWDEVRSWAVMNGYKINPGKSCASDHPIHSINGFDIMAWCNARSTLESLEPVYILDSSGTPFKGENVGMANIYADLSLSGYRLPTPEEWEYAAKGGNKSEGFKYIGSNDINEVSWYMLNSENAYCDYFSGQTGRSLAGHSGPVFTSLGTWPVGQKKPNELGLYDMGGNVAEYVWKYDGGQTKTNRIYLYHRGGNFRSSSAQCSPDANPGVFRQSNVGDVSARFEGFRLARSQKDKEIH